MADSPATQGPPIAQRSREGARLIGATALLIAWLLLLLVGHPLGPAVHLLLAGALLVVPWRLARP